MKKSLISILILLFAFPSLAGDKRLAVLKSLILPGWGQIQEGNRARAAYYLSAEAVTWGLKAGYVWQANEMKDAYKAFARTHSGAEQMIDSDEFYRIMSTFRSAEEYNMQVKMSARNTYLDPIYGLNEDWVGYNSYLEQNLIPDASSWLWSDTDVWENYRMKRFESQEALKSAKVLTFALVLNRLLASADVIFADKVWKTKVPAISADPINGEIHLSIKF
jgi:hypothetical protein